MLSFSDYQRAVNRYSCVVALTGAVAFVLFDVMLWINLQLLEVFSPSIRDFLDALLSPGCKGVIFILCLFALSSPPSLLLLIFVIRRARRQAALRCPSCGGELASEWSRQLVLLSLHCPHCRNQVVECIESETASDSHATPPRANLIRKDYKQIRNEIRGHLRFAAVAWGIALPLMYAIIFWSTTSSGLPQRDWAFVAFAPIGIVASFLSMMWFAAYGDLKRARIRDEHFAKLRPKPDRNDESPIGDP